MTRMKVLFVNENIGGHATVHLHLERLLADRDDVAAEFLHVPPAGLVRRILGAPVPGLARLDLDLQPLRAQLALSASVRWSLRGRLGEFDALHVYTHNAGMCSVGPMRRVPTVVSLDTTNARNAYRLPYRHPTRATTFTLPLTKFFERRVHHAARYVVANSEEAAESLRSDYSLPESKLRTIPAGIAAPRFDPVVAPGVAPGDRLPQLVFVGRQMVRKGGELLREVHQAHLAQRCELVLVTTEPVRPGRNVTVVADLRQGEDRLWTLLRSGAIFVFPSTIDAAPNAVLEAMAAGLPVVAIRTGAVGEMVVHGETGLLLEGPDPEALRAAIESLLDDPERGANMGAAGRARLDRRYDARVCVEELLTVILAATGRAPAAAAGRASTDATGTPTPTAAASVSLPSATLPSATLPSTRPTDRVRGVARSLAVNGGAVWQLAAHRRAAGGAAVMAYHDVTAGEPREHYSVSAARLREHIVTLRRLGLEIVPLADIVRRLKRDEPVDALAAITFDDALVGVHRHALAVLRSEGAPATIFVVTDAIGVDPSWWPGAERTMTADELSDARAAGVTLESHSRAHRSLPTLSPSELLADFHHSRTVLAEQLDSSGSLLAYPFGHHGPTVRAAAREAGFDAAFTFLNGRPRPGDDLFRLARLTGWRGMRSIDLARHLGRNPDRWPDHQADVVLDGGPSNSPANSLTNSPADTAASGDAARPSLAEDELLR